MTTTNKAIDNAVQNTITGPKPDTDLHGKPLVEVLKNLDKGDLRVAYAAMNAAYDIQWGKDGIEEVQTKLTGLQGKVGEQVYAIAKVAMVHCEGRLAIAAPYFKALCNQAEEMKTKWYAGKYHEEKPIGQLIPLWSAYKSSIAKGMEKGINPNTLIEDTDSPKFATAAQYRAEVQRIEKEAKGANERDDGTKTNGEVKTGLAVITSGWSPQLRASMEVMCAALNGLTHEEQDKFSKQILDVAAAVTTFANARKREVVTDNRTDAQKAVGSDVVSEDLDPGTKAALQTAIDGDKAPVVAEGKASKRKGAKAA